MNGSEGLAVTGVERDLPVETGEAVAVVLPPFAALESNPDDFKATTLPELPILDKEMRPRGCSSLRLGDGLRDVHLKQLWFSVQGSSTLNPREYVKLNSLL